MARTACGRRREDAVLNANYIRASLGDLMSAPFGDRPCMHEALFDDRWLKDTGVTTLDFAKAMIDEGFHPMTMYFPLVVHGAMLIEPTEVGIEGEPRPVHHDAARSGDRRQAGERERFQAAPVLPPPAARRDARGAPAGAALDQALSPLDLPYEADMALGPRAAIVPLEPKD